MNKPISFLSLYNECADKTYTTVGAVIWHSTTGEFDGDSYYLVKALIRNAL